MSDNPLNNSLGELKAQIEELKRSQEAMRHLFDMVLKEVDDVLWYNRVGDVAEIGKYRLTGPPSQHVPNPTAQGAGNPVVFHAYTFTPKDLDVVDRRPMIVLPHLGIHSNFNCNYQFPMDNIVRELIQQGYIIVAPEYRGSTGYSQRFYELIDYGGLEVEDTYAARNWMVEHCGLVDPDRIGIIGWSHGGLHTLMNVFRHPDAYKVAYAGVPVTDLIARMGYKTQQYRDLYEADYHIGKSAYEDVNEYRRRSPVWNAEKLQTPLLVHTNTADEDVNVLEVEYLIKSLKAAGKEFEYKIYKNAPGGHSFNQIDTELARESRKEVYKFFARYLNPPHPAV